MAVTYSTTVAQGRLQVVLDLTGSKVLAAATGSFSAGQLVIGTASLSGATGVLATIALSATPFTLSGRVLTLSGVPLSVNASATGTAALAEIRNNAGTTIVSGLTVGTSATDVIITTTSVVSGQSVQVTALTITHP